MPNEIAMAVPNKSSRMELPRAAQRSQMPSTRARPNASSATVADHARNGIVEAGMKEFTCAVYRMNPAIQTEAVGDPREE